MKKHQILDWIVTFLLVTLAFEVLTPRGLLWRPVRPWLEARGIPQWLFSLVAFVIVLCLLGWWTKTALLRMLPENIGFRAAPLHEFPALDLDSLGRYTTVFQSLGFVWVTDYTLTNDVTPGMQGFGRLFIHPQHHCYAEVNQVFANGRAAVPVACMVASCIEGGWALSTTSRKPDGGTYMLRRPTSLWTSHPGAAPAALLQTHLADRAALAQRVGGAVRTDLSWDAYFAHEQQEARDRRKVMKRKNIAVAIAEMIMFSFRPKMEWMGEGKRAQAPAQALSSA